MFPSPYCEGCIVGDGCREQHTGLGCSELGPVDPTVLHINSPEWFLRFAEVNTFELNVRAIPQQLPTLPSYIPAIRPSQWKYAPPHSPSSALAIRLADVPALARRVRGRRITAKQLLGMSPNEKLIVLGFAHDRVLEEHWPEGKRRNLLTAIRQIEPDAAIAWNFSVWYRHARGWIVPRPEQMYNLKRSLKEYAEMQAIGIPAIPHIYWGVPEDVDRWASWLSENPVVQVFSVDLQTLDHRDAFNRALDHLRSLRRKLGSRDLHILFSGVCQVGRVRELKRAWPNSSLVNLAAQYGSGSFRFKPCYGLDRPWRADPNSWTRPEVFIEIVRQYSLLCDYRGTPPVHLRSIS
jgi:hypothetical protein